MSFVSLCFLFCSSGKVSKYKYKVLSHKMASLHTSSLPNVAETIEKCVTELYGKKTSQLLFNSKTKTNAKSVCESILSDAEVDISCIWAHCFFKVFDVVNNTPALEVSAAWSRLLRVAQSQFSRLSTLKQLLSVYYTSELGGTREFIESTEISDCKVLKDEDKPRVCDVPMLVMKLAVTDSVEAALEFGAGKLEEMKRSIEAERANREALCSKMSYTSPSTSEGFLTSVTETLGKLNICETGLLSFVRTKQLVNALHRIKK